MYWVQKGAFLRYFKQNVILIFKKNYSMKHFNRTEKTLKGLIDVILGGSHDVVRTLKAAGHMSQKSVNHA